MTCIVALEYDSKVYMGADSQMTQGETKFVSRDPKIFKRGDMLFGCSGWTRTNQLLMYALDIPEREMTRQTGMPYHTDMRYLVNQFVPAVRQCFKDAGFTSYNDGEEEGEFFMFGYKGVIYQLESNFQITSCIDGNMAIGSGCQYALGSLYTSLEVQDPVSRIRTALFAAQKYDIYVCEPFTILSL